MRANQFIYEGKNTPCIVVDVQPSYAAWILNDIDMEKLGVFLKSQKSPTLMFVNADETGMTDDNIEWDIVPWWNENIFGEDENYDEGIDSFWNRTKVIDKGYGYLRGWMDLEVEPSLIIKVIRAMYQAKVNDSRDLIDVEDYDWRSEEWQEYVDKFFGDDVDPQILHNVLSYPDPISVEWTSVAQLKKFSGAYIMGGGRNECLREVELLMNAFNIKYKRIEDFVY